MPLGGSMSDHDMKVAGRKTDDQGISIRACRPTITRRSGFRSGAAACSKPLIGRAPPKVAILNESAAKKYFPGENPIGQTVEVDESPRTIVGIVGDVHQTSLETEPVTEVYVPMSQYPGSSAELVIRTAGDPYAVLPAVKAAVLARAARRPAPQRADDGGVDGPSRRAAPAEHAAARPLRSARARHLRRRHLRRDGLHRGAAHARDWRAHGARRDAGARGRDGAPQRRASWSCSVWRSAESARGTSSAAAKTFLFQLETNDPRAFVVAVSSLALAALIASAMPARRAASVDPMVALRAE